MGVRAKMWQAYAFRGFTVRVIQQWDDPFGMAMVRIADIRDDERAEGMPEAVFLSQAIPVAASER
jgi:hypothetical protein